MRNASTFACGLGVCALVASTLVIAEPSGHATSPPQSATTTAANDPSAGLFKEMCTACHDATPITAARRTMADWENVFKKMIETGATGTEKDFENVFEYLLRYYGKVLMNSARPDEIKLVLGLSQKDADAIVAYRKEHGPFADLDALKKVPEIDVKKLDEHKDAIVF